MPATRALPLALVAVALASLICACSALGDQQTSGAASLKELTNDDQQQQQQQQLLQAQPQVLLEGAGGRANGASIRANSRLLAVPHSLARFLFYNSRGPNERQGQAAAYAPELASASTNGYKRSSSQLDALNGVTLGKRSAPLDYFVNYEPVFARQGLTRTPARVYDMRWAPLDSFEGPASGAGNY